MLNLYPKGVKPDFVLCNLFLCRMPLDVRVHLLDLNINDNNALAKKAGSLFQSHQFSTENSLSDNLHTPIHPIWPPQQRTRHNSTSSTIYSASSGHSALCQPPTPTEDLRLLSPSPTGFTRLRAIRLRNARNSALGPKTKQPVGRHFFPHRIFTLTVQPPGHTLIQTFPSGLQSFHFSISSPSFIFQLLPTNPPWPPVDPQ